MKPAAILAFALGPISSAILGVITVPIIAWFFSQEDVGRITMLQIFLGFSTMLFSLGLDQAYIREFHEEQDKPALLKRALLPGLLLLTFTLLTIISFGGLLADWLFDISSLAFSLLIVIAMFSSFISRFLSLILRMNERGLAYSMSQLLPKAVLLAVIVLYVALDFAKNINNLLLANVVAILSVSFVYSWNTRGEWLKAITAHFDFLKFKKMFKFGMPLIWGGVSFWGLTAVDKIFLRAMTSFEELALYSVSVSFASAALVFQTIFSTVWAPIVYKWAKSGEGLDNVHKVVRYVLLVVVLCFCLAGLLSPLITYLLPDNYEAVQWIVVACIGYPLLYTLSETTVVGINISRRTGFSMLSSLIALIVNCCGNFFLVPHYGAAGAAVSTCVSFFVFFILRTEFSIFCWRTSPRVLIYSYTFLVVIGSSIAALYGKYFPELLIIYWLCLLISVFLFFRCEFYNFFNFIRNSSVF